MTRVLEMVSRDKKFIHIVTFVKKYIISIGAHLNKIKVTTRGEIYFSLHILLTLWVQLKHFFKIFLGDGLLYSFPSLFLFLPLEYSTHCDFWNGKSKKSISGKGKKSSIFSIQTREISKSSCVTPILEAALKKDIFFLLQAKMLTTFFLLSSLLPPKRLAKVKLS